MTQFEKGDPENFSERSRLVLFVQVRSVTTIFKPLYEKAAMQGRVTVLKSLNSKWCTLWLERLKKSFLHQSIRVS